MKIGTGEFYSPSEITKNVCDKCKKDINRFICVTYDFTWSDGYDTYGEEVETCSVECLLDILSDEDLDYYPSNNTVTITLPSDDARRILSLLQSSRKETDNDRL